MIVKRKTLWEKFGKLNFKLFYCIIGLFSRSMAKRFMYIGLADRSIYEDIFNDPILNVNAFGKVLPSPLGIAAGFDTTFKYNDELVQYGFGFEEFGTFTQVPMSDSPKVKFLNKHKSLLVAQEFYGNKGILFAQKALSERRHLPTVAGISLALNTHANNEKEGNTLFPEIQRALGQMTHQVAPYCDYIVINLSHPRLPISSVLSNVSILEELIDHLHQTIEAAAPITKTKLLFKLPLDLNQTHIGLLADAFLTHHVDGLIIGGYTKPLSLTEKLVGHKEIGYISGAAVKELSNKVLSAFYQATRGQIPLIACGGVFTGDDAFEKISLGASLVQIHSAILYKGPSIGNQIAKRLSYLLKTKGYPNVQAAVGSANKIQPKPIEDA